MATKQSEVAARSSAMDTMPEWIRLTGAYWTFPIARNDAEKTLVETELRQFFDRSTPDGMELCSVIRWMAGPEGKQEKAPTLRELIRAICITRKKLRQEADGYRHGENVEADCKAAMVQATRHRERWNIMNQPNFYIGAVRDTTHEECIRLYDWACERWPDFAEATDAIKRGYAADYAKFKTEKPERLPFWPDGKQETS